VLSYSWKFEGCLKLWTLDLLVSVLMIFWIPPEYGRCDDRLTLASSNCCGLLALGFIILSSLIFGMLFGVKLVAWMIPL
jgi:hypothetical protein